MHTASKRWHRASQLYQLLSEKKTLCCQLYPTHYAAVQINNCLRITSTIKVAPMKITDNFHYIWKPSPAYNKIDTFADSKDKWDTKEGSDKSICMHSDMAAKKHLSG